MRKKYQATVPVAIYVILADGLPMIIVFTFFLRLLIGHSTCLFRPPTLFILFVTALGLGLKVLSMKHLGEFLIRDVDPDQKLIDEMFPEELAGTRRLLNAKVRAMAIDIVVGIINIATALWLFRSWVACIKSLPIS